VNTPGMITLHTEAARLLAVEVLLAEPEALADDVLESCLYLLRDRLQAKDGGTSDGAARRPGARAGDCGAPAADHAAHRGDGRPD
jgi:hypothetical protein